MQDHVSSAPEQQGKEVTFIVKPRKVVTVIFTEVPESDVELLHFLARARLTSFLVLCGCLGPLSVSF